MLPDGGKRKSPRLIPFFLASILDAMLEPGRCQADAEQAGDSNSQTPTTAKH
jgi:hypothetical protein